MNTQPSPAFAIVGRHNSGKTTLIERVIAELTARGFDVGSVKHHSHDKFDIDYPGKDSYRHRAAGATETVIASPLKLARIKTLNHELECADIVRSMPGHDVVCVEGYRKSGLPTIEIMRAANDADMTVAQEFYACAKAGVDLGADFVQRGRAIAKAHIKNGEGGAGDVTSPQAQASKNPNAEQAAARDLVEKMPSAHTIAVITDIPRAREAAHIYAIPSFDINDVPGICDFLESHVVRPKITVCIQAGGESRRMGRSKATVPFRGRPLIQHMVERLRDAADELIITTNEPQNLEFLHDDYPELHIRLITDDYDFRGALPGLHTAINAATYPFVAVVACDMVFASSSLVLAEAFEMAVEGCDVVVPANSHGFEPFHAIYRKQTCLRGIERVMRQNCTRVQCLFDDKDIKVKTLSQDEVLKIEPRGGCFINANTPDELARLEESYIGE